MAQATAPHANVHAKSSMFPGLPTDKVQIAIAMRPWAALSDGARRKSYGLITDEGMRTKSTSQQNSMNPTHPAPLPSKKVIDQLMQKEQVRKIRKDTMSCEFQNFKHFKRPATLCGSTWIHVDLRYRVS
eukprot:scpid83412/ scgid30617/ 